MWAPRPELSRAKRSMMGNDLTNLGNQLWHSNEHHGDAQSLTGWIRMPAQGDRNDGKDGVDEADGPPEPVAQVRVLPGALGILAGQKAFLVSP